MILESLNDFAARHLPFDYLLELDKNGEFPEEILRKMYDPEILGLHLVLMPEEYGGFGGSTYDVYRLCEALARIDLGIATAIFATFLGTDPIRVGGTEEQKNKWMTKIADEGALVAYGATEPDAGSDLGASTTRAEAVMENDVITGYRITGTKQWISNGGLADIYLILARTPKGFCWFIMEKGSEGLSINAPEDKHGIRAANTAAFTMDNVYVPADQLVGEKEGFGLMQAQAVFGYTRLMVAAFGLGGGWDAIERAIKYSQQRIQAGGPLSEKQGYTHKLIVPYAVRLEASKAYIEEIAARLDGGEEGLQTEGAIAKYLATETGNAAAEAAIQALGGYGYTREYAVEKIKRDVRITMIYEGTNEIMEMTIARNRWQNHLKSRETYYLELSRNLAELHKSAPDVGAGTVSLALAALNSIFANCRAQKLTRNQHVLFKLGELAALAETSMVFSQSAAKEEYNETVKFDTDTWRAMSRTYARETALKIALDGIHIVLGAGTGNSSALEQTMKVSEILNSQRGMIADMDLISKSLNSVFRSK
jgi:alkylation response protein AidB-like acyl-CoA dehydrogenase